MNIKLALNPSKNFISNYFNLIFIRSIRKISNIPAPNNFYWNDLHDNTESKFNKILIANRGEIACRIIKTCKRLGISTVAVYSEADFNSSFVQMADEAVYLGPAPSLQSYLNLNSILNAVVETGAQAVHPGYGFLSENKNFAKQLEQIGVVFIGPNSKAIHLMGDKLESKRIARLANVNCIPGYDGEIKTVEEAVRISSEIGYPVMIKPLAGGGGKGMRVVWNARQIEEVLDLCKAEAKSSFDDERILIEKFIENPRHIEIQVLCDKLGNAVHLNERECSIQRRNQKIIEEAPSSFVNEELRMRMGEQAISLAKAVGYDSAGTVEFLMDSSRNFYFLEMNTRLQVEHPVTECITGIDIVHQMIRLAKGHPLLLKQSDVGIRGWAMECRVYAENPFKSFGLPCVGRLKHYQEPVAEQTDGGDVLCHSGVQTGSEVSIYYDPMLCKLITCSADRQGARSTMIKALDRLVINGIQHNVPLLREIMCQDQFINGNLCTNYLDQIYPEGFKGKQLTEEERNLLISVAVSLYIKDHGRYGIDSEHQSWNLVSTISHLSERIAPDVWCTARKDRNAAAYCVELSEWTDKPGSPQSPSDNNDEVVRLNDVVVRDTAKKIVTISDNFTLVDKLIHVAWGNELVTLQNLGRKSHTLHLQYLGLEFKVTILPTMAAWYQSSYLTLAKPKKVTDNLYLAPMPGLVRSISVKPNDQIVEGQELCVLEAMKMQNRIYAHKNSQVRSICCKPGDSVSQGDLLIELEN